MLSKSTRNAFKASGANFAAKHFKKTKDAQCRHKHGRAHTYAEGQAQAPELEIGKVVFGVAKLRQTLREVECGEDKLIGVDPVANFKESQR